MSEAKRILIIVHDHQTRVDLRLHYEKDGHHVVSAATTANALNLLEYISSPDLIIVGGPFPFLSVPDLLTILKGDKKFGKIPVAVIKGSVSSLGESYLEIDMNDRQRWSDVLKEFV